METSRQNSAAAALLWVIGQSFVQVKENTAALPAKKAQHDPTLHQTPGLNVAGKLMKLSILWGQSEKTAAHYTWCGSSALLQKESC